MSLDIIRCAATGWSKVYALRLGRRHRLPTCVRAWLRRHSLGSPYRPGLGLEDVEQVAANDEAASDAANPAERTSRSAKRRSNRGSLPST